MDFKRDKRQNIQKKLDFSSEPTGEARPARREETESRQTKCQHVARFAARQSSTSSFA